MDYWKFQNAQKNPVKWGSASKNSHSYLLNYEQKSFTPPICSTVL